MNEIKKAVKYFLEGQLQKKGPLLIGFSGGPDSLALTSVLLEMGVPIELAHLDHGYRAESAREALMLKEWAAERKIPFYLKRLSQLPQNNLEDYFRQERYQFFSELFDQKKYQALVLAHHQNDLEETTLKRVLEGAFLTQLSPIRAVSQREKMVVWRPLLTVLKSTLLKYIEENNLRPILDPTNEDQSNLRSRMRMQILPFLEQSLQKNIRSSLHALAENSELLGDYLMEQTRGKILEHSSSFGTLLDFTIAPLHKLEYLYILKMNFHREQLAVSRDSLHKIQRLLDEKVANKKFLAGSKTLYIDRGRLLILKTIEKPSNQEVVLKVGEFELGLWKVVVEKTEQWQNSFSDWKTIFLNKGLIFIQVPEDEYVLRYSLPGQDKAWQTSKTMSQFLNAKKIPSILLERVPVIGKEGHVFEFLSQNRVSLKSKAYLNIFLSMKND